VKNDAAALADLIARLSRMSDDAGHMDW
jgi:hypothetical protein